MTQDQIQLLISNGLSPERPDVEKLIETHISWVILTPKHAYKIKKPTHFSFLDFSTSDKRLFYCQREFQLNKRLAPEMYLDVLPVKNTGSGLQISKELPGQIIDHALLMKRMDFSRQMDLLLGRGEVHLYHLDGIAAQLAEFHLKTDRVRPEQYEMNIHEKFADLSSVSHILKADFGEEVVLTIKEIVDFSCHFIKQHTNRIKERVNQGYVIDGHGDLHSKNIFLLQQPVIFDCIEFNDDFRQIDVLNDIAFLCMDLDSHNRSDFAQYFLEKYLEGNPCLPEKEDRRLFQYYKMYRANVRLKVSALGLAQQEKNQNTISLVENCRKYYNLLKEYFNAMS